MERQKNGKYYVDIISDFSDRSKDILNIGYLNILPLLL